MRSAVVAGLLLGTAHGLVALDVSLGHRNESAQIHKTVYYNLHF